ncbi:MAG TPA: alkaline phosphatase family protein [Sphingobacteriaceae bacterium]|nr:alkaline phosphatase family protein [Sphingobacteriaceae bacterium]
MRKTIILLLFTIISNLVFSQTTRTKNVIVVTFDGYRWKELFRGADSAFLFGKTYNTQDSTERIKKFWGKNIQERREKLTPFFWNTIAKKGQIYGNRDAGNFVNVKNKYWFSYPGYNEMFTGYPDSLINSNNFRPNPNKTIHEFINEQPGYKGKVAAFTSWDAFDRILNEKRGGFLVNSGYENLEGENLTEVQKALNEQQHYLPKIFGHSERPDAVTYIMAKNYLKQKHPKFLQLSFIDTDAFGHAGKYDFYLDAAHYNDAMIADLWKTIQADPFYKDQTTLFIAVDHGRGEGSTWKNHNINVPNADQVWFAVMGPDTKPMGEIKSKGQLYQNQYAKTITALLGFNFTGIHTIGEIIKTVIK